MIRKALLQDENFIVSVARERYPAFDEFRAREWLRRIISDRSCAVIRSAHGYVIGHLTTPFYAPAPRCVMLFIAARKNAPPLEGVRLLRALDGWRRARGATSLHFGEDTGVDLSALAKRIGAVRERPSYRIEGGPVAVVAVAHDYGSPIVARALELMSDGRRG